MSEEKKKIKDLALELNLQAKDVLAKAKELGIAAAKAVTSSLSEADITRLRNHYAPASDKPEVIVRRRSRRPAAKEADVSPPASSAAEPEAIAADDPVADTDTPAEQPSAESKKKKAASSSEKSGARIIQLPGEEKTKPPAAEEIAQPDVAAEDAPDVVSIEPVAPAPAVPAPEVVAEAVPVAPEAAASAAPAEQEISPASNVDESADSAPQDPINQEVPEPMLESAKQNARVLRPAVFSAEPERSADGRAVSSAPALSPRAEQSDADTPGASRAQEPAATQVRVISRPDPASPAPRQQRERGEREGGAPRPARPASRPGGAPRPAAGYEAPRGGAASPQQPPLPGQETAEQGRKKRQKGRRTVEFTSSRDSEDIGWSKTSVRRNKSRKREAAAPLGGTQPVKAVKRIIKVEEFIRVADLAHQMGLKSGEVIKILFNLGVMATINQSLDIDTATLVAGEFGYEVEKVGFFEEDVLSAQQEPDAEKDLLPRPPVVTIMGHVDHGKTSLLDAIRAASVASGEAGGITQHIGAYHVKTAKGEIVFLDTPGHEAFTAMRARGAEVTDIVILVVAADDGVMEQTKEAISHAKAAKVPIMVAVNKMDKPEANPERVKRELSENGLLAEEWGGDTSFSYVSAKTRQGLDDLLDLLVLQAEVLELKANPDKAAYGHIVEAKLDKGRGSLGTVLIQQGTLRLGDTFVCGVHSGRVRAMFNDQGKKVKEAGPSMPVEVQGFEGVPEAGEEFIGIADEKTARRIAEVRALKQRERELAKESKITLETFLARKPEDVEAVVLNLVVKSDVQGSLEAIIDALNKMSTEKVRINVIHGGTGAISESDVLLATASNAIIIGFNVRPTSKGKELAEAEKVDMRFYDVIYKLVEEIKSAMEGMLAPVAKEVFLGTAEVRDTFSVPKVGVVAGCHISDGKVVRNCSARLLRDGVVVYSGKVGSLRRFKDDVREVAKGYECGIGLENYNDIKVGDVIEAYEIVEEAATL